MPGTAGRPTPSTPTSQPEGAFKPLTIASDSLTAAIIPYGATLTHVALRRSRDPGRNLVLSYRDPHAFERGRDYRGAVIGRVSGRLAGETLTFEGKTFRLPHNRPGMTVHGGPRGLSERSWTVVDHAADLLRFAITADEDDDGLPGAVRIEATYAVRGFTVSLDVTAHAQRSGPLRLTHHAYWRLQPTGDVRASALHPAPNAYLERDAANLATGRIAPLPAMTAPLTLSALHQSLRRRDGLDAPLDDYVMFATGPDGTTRVTMTPSPPHPILHIKTNAPGVHIYDGAFLAEPHCGVALEAQDHPWTTGPAAWAAPVLKAGASKTLSIEWTLQEQAPAATSRTDPGPVRS